MLVVGRREGGLTTNVDKLVRENFLDLFVELLEVVVRRIQCRVERPCSRRRSKVVKGGQRRRRKAATRLTAIHSGSLTGTKRQRTGESVEGREKELPRKVRVGEWTDRCRSWCPRCRSSRSAGQCSPNRPGRDLFIQLCSHPPTVSGRRGAGRHFSCERGCTRDDYGKAGPFSVERLKMDLPFCEQIVCTNKPTATISGPPNTRRWTREGACRRSPCDAIGRDG